MGIMFDLPLVEPTAVLDIYVGGLARIEKLGNGVLRFVLFSEQENSMGRERVIVARLIWAAADLPDAIRKTAKACATEGVLCACAQMESCH